MPASTSCHASSAIRVSRRRRRRASPGDSRNPTPCRLGYFDIFPTPPARPVADLRPSPFPPPPISGSKVAARGTPVSLNVCACPVASRAQSLQVVAANKLSRPNLTDESIQMFKTGPNDTGSSSLQIALLTKRIESLTEHLLINKKDYACQRGLRILLGQRSRLTKYLQKKDYAEYERVMNGLGLRIKSA